MFVERVRHAHVGGHVTCLYARLVNQSRCGDVAAGGVRCLLGLWSLLARTRKRTRMAFDGNTRNLGNDPSHPARGASRYSGHSCQTRRAPEGRRGCGCRFDGCRQEGRRGSRARARTRSGILRVREFVPLFGADPRINPVNGFSQNKLRWCLARSQTNSPKNLTINDWCSSPITPQSPSRRLDRRLAGSSKERPFSRRRVFCCSSCPRHPPKRHWSSNGLGQRSGLEFWMNRCPCSRVAPRSAMLLIIL
ncbi:hypothetical protein ABIB94_008210 [Bradyrhizobium sp. JR7.2]